MPVTVPVGSIVAMEIGLLLQLPPTVASERVTEVPTSMLEAPDIEAGDAFTVTCCIVEKPKGP